MAATVPVGPGWRSATASDADVASSTASASGRPSGPTASSR